MNPSGAVVYIVKRNDGTLVIMSVKSEYVPSYQCPNVSYGSRENAQMDKANFALPRSVKLRASSLSCANSSSIVYPGSNAGTSKSNVALSVAVNRVDDEYANSDVNSAVVVDVRSIRTLRDMDNNDRPTRVQLYGLDRALHGLTGDTRNHAGERRPYASGDLK